MQNQVTTNEPVDRQVALAERKRKRDAFLVAFYDLYTETGKTWINRPTVIERSELSTQDAYEAEDYWSGLGVIQVQTMGPAGLIELLPYGIEVVEDSIRYATEQQAALESSPAPPQETQVNNVMDIFISHASADSPIASALIDVLRSALNIAPERIRCTSVTGYRLPVGVDFAEQLRQEVFESRMFIGLITPTSATSSFVLFELGARWGARKSLLPLLAGGADSTTLPGPLQAINALSSESEAQVIQFVENVGARLEITPNSVTSYFQQLTALNTISRAIP